MQSLPLRGHGALRRPFLLPLLAFVLLLIGTPEALAHGVPEGDKGFIQESSGVLLMTEKDAVKCAAIVTCEAWVLPVDAHLDRNPEGNALLDIILEKLNGPSPA